MITVLFNRVEEPEVIRVITVGSFRRRLTVAEKVAIRVSTDPVVQVLSEDLTSSNYVDLDSKEIIEGLQYLVSVEILEDSRVPELLQNGTEDERP
jgi:hypothetical protein